ncbi:NPC intracellular cholesterol transporter 1-like isoform X3 [Convolutriloba macropyga]|uniref:NPC intracellular cholesterol transporter 1-like isoform X3 n=1 Tax=Convolutriloba macropyga TaxID=536237 RepID=UPI003F51EFFB
MIPWWCSQLVVVLLVLIQASATARHRKGLCSTKSACNRGGQADFLQACVSNTEPFTFEPESEEETEAFYFLKSVCPHLMNSPTKVCCDTAQLLQLKNQMQVLYQLLKRCPSCVQNFQGMWCNVLCHPDQSTFLDVTADVAYNGKWTKDTPPEYERSADEITVYLSRNYADNLYHSCSNVIFPSTGMPVIKTMCHGRSPETCSPRHFLDFVGGKDNGRSPSEFNFVIVEQNDRLPQGMEPLDLPLFQCNANGYNNSAPCSCIDCPAACNKESEVISSKLEDVNSNPWRVLGIPGYVVIVAVLYIAVSCIYLVVSYMHCLYYKKPEDDTSYIDASYHSQYSTTGGHHCPSKTSSSSGDTSEFSDGVKKGDGHGEVVLEIGVFEQIGRQFQMALHAFFFQWGLTMANQPVAALLFGTMVVAVCSNGLHYVRWTTDPVELWSSSNSQAYREMVHFNNHFGPFYRIEQIIVKLRTNSTGHYIYTPREEDNLYRPQDFNPILDAPILHEILYLQENISSLVIYSDRHERNVSLDDICHKPMHPVNSRCAVTSATEWFQNSHDNIDQKAYRTRRKRVVKANHYKHISACIESPTRLDDGTALKSSCMASWGGPIEPLIALGGFPESVQHLLDNPVYQGEFRKATALVITFLVKNSLNVRERELAEDFEAGYLEVVRAFARRHPHLSVAYQAQRSIEDEIERESEGDIKTVVCSYLIMFGYITCCLGKMGGLGLRTLVDMKITVGLGGVVIVLSSVACSIGVFGFIGVPATLIIMEVVPFLVLAVGVDNIFILVQYYQRYKPPKDRNEPLEVQIATVFSKVAPSMLLSSCAEALAFFLGAMTPMPAVRTFSLYAGMAVTFDFLFQITCFVGLLTLDAKRQKDARLDVACCVPVDSCEKTSQQEGMVYALFRDYYSPILLNDLVRPLVMVVFLGWFLACCCMMPHIPIGLDQSLSLPSDSYMRDYFAAISEDLNVGSPVYFVIKGPFPYDDPEKRKLVCSLSGCSPNSIVEQISMAASEKNKTKIAKMPNSWVDDYMDWSEPESKCCRFNSTNSKELGSSKEFCNASVVSKACKSCNIDGGVLKGRQFYNLLPYFLSDIPSQDCPKAGKAAYSSAVSLKTVPNPPYVQSDNSPDTVGDAVVASYFMTYHTALRTSSDFTEALMESRGLAAKISQTLGVEVYPYSVFYVFYEQYVTIVRDTLVNMSVSLMSIFLVTFFLLGLDIVSAVFVGVTILMIIVSMCGLMYLWDISLNAISLVNLVMAVGISVEFSAHTVRTFAVNPNPSRLQRARESLLEMGSSVLSGITLTKLGGILVLGFSNSQLFKVFYFRMYLGIVIFGAAHGLAFLPIVLSYIGPFSKQKRLRRQAGARRRCDGVHGDDYDSMAPQLNLSTAICPKETEVIVSNKGGDEGSEDKFNLGEDTANVGPGNKDHRNVHVTPSSALKSDKEACTNFSNNSKTNVGILEPESHGKLCGTGFVEKPQTSLMRPSCSSGSFQFGQTLSNDISESNIDSIDCVEKEDVSGAVFVSSYNIPSAAVPPVCATTSNTRSEDPKFPPLSLYHDNGAPNVFDNDSAFSAA